MQGIHDAERRRGRPLASPLGALTLATLVAHAGELRIEADTNDLLRIDGNGNAILSEGWIVENARQHPWTSELNPRDGVTHVIIRNNAVENVAVLDRLRGNRYLRSRTVCCNSLNNTPCTIRNLWRFLIATNLVT